MRRYLDRMMRASQYSVGDRIMRDHNGPLVVTGVRVDRDRREFVQIDHDQRWLPSESVRPTSRLRARGLIAS